MADVAVEKLSIARAEAESIYGAIGKVHCPYLRRDVHFNRIGFEHLLFNSWNHPRSHTEQYTRLRFIPLAKEVLESSHTLQEYDERRMMIRQKINSRWEKRPKDVVYYVFVAIVRSFKARVKVVVKHVEGSEPIFYSIYPSWRVEKKEGELEKKIYYSGNIEDL